MKSAVQTAIVFVHRASEFADPATFDISEAFRVVYGALRAFEGPGMPAPSPRDMFEAVNLALSSLPGNRVAMRFVGLADGGYLTECVEYGEPRSVDARDNA